MAGPMVVRGRISPVDLLREHRLTTSVANSLLMVRETECSKTLVRAPSLYSIASWPRLDHRLPYLRDLGFGDSTLTPTLHHRVTTRL